MTWAKLSDSLSWSQGHSGKGYLLHDGTIKTWNTDPFNPVDQSLLHAQNHELSPIALNFEIDPDGGLVTANPTNKLAPVMQADPRLYDAGQRPVFEDDFNLQHFKPKPTMEGKPDYNLIMSSWTWDGPHRNRWTGKLCDCGWGRPPRRRLAHRTAGLELRKLLKAPDKAWRTPEGQAFLEHLKTHLTHYDEDGEELGPGYDSLFPYLARRFKQGDVRLNSQEPHNRTSLEYARYPPGPDGVVADHDWASVHHVIPRWHEWYEARQHPLRRGVDVMDKQFAPQMLDRRSVEHQNALHEAKQKENWLREYGPDSGERDAEPKHVFGPEAGKYKGFQVVPLNGRQAEGDSEALGHCIGSDEQPYKHNIESGNIDAYSLRDKEGYPKVAWHINPSGDSIGHMQGASGYPKEEYRKLISMFNEHHQLPDNESGHEEELEGQYDDYVTLPAATDMDDYVRYHGDDRWEYAEDHGNIGPDTEVNNATPDWFNIAQNYLSGGSTGYDYFHQTLSDNNDISELEDALERQFDPDDEEERSIIEHHWNEAVPARNQIEVPSPKANEVDDYNEAMENHGEAEPDDWDGLAQDYLNHSEHYGQNHGYGMSPYQQFHEHLQNNKDYGWTVPKPHSEIMRQALRNNVNWNDYIHRQAIEHWNRGNPTNGIVQPPPPPPEPYPGQMEIPGHPWPLGDPSHYETPGTPAETPKPGQYVLPTNDPTIVPRYGDWHFAAADAEEDELHVGLEIPAAITKQIKAWVDEQDWPEGTEKEDPSDYHITLLYAHNGHDAHYDADWFDHTKGEEVSISGIDEFGDDDEKAIVLRIASPAVKTHAVRMQDSAESHDLDVSKFPGGYKPHLTIAYGPGKPKGSPPKLKFRTGPSSVSPPRTSSWHLADGPYGYTNNDTAQVALTMDNDSALSEASRQLVERGGTPEDLRNWAIRKIISPHNRQQIKDAQEWNAIPLEERKRRKRQHDIDQFGEAAVNIGEGLMQPFNDWNNEGKDEDEIRREEEYEAPDLIDPELVNWDELHQGILDEFNENAEYERNRASGLGWANNGGDHEDQMRDAFYRFHGAIPEEDIQAELGPGYHGDDPRNYFRRSVNIPFEHMEQLSGWPEHYSLGSMWDHRYLLAEQKAREELTAQGIDPETIEKLLDDSARGGGFFGPRDYVKPHFPGGKYDTPINMEDPGERAAFLSFPRVQEIQQNGYDMSLGDLYSDVKHAIAGGQPHPYIGQMQQALQQQNYTPEQIAEIMRQRWRWDEEQKQRFPVDAAPPLDQWEQQRQQQQALDQPGNLTIPQDWTSAIRNTRSQDSRSFARMTTGSSGSIVQSSDSMLAPAVELREWLADLGGSEPEAPSIHHDTAEDTVMAPAATQRTDLPYFPPANVPKEYKLGAKDINGDEIDEPVGGWETWGGEPTWDHTEPCSFCGSPNTGSRRVPQSKPPEEQWLQGNCKDCLANWSINEDQPRTQGQTDPTWDDFWRGSSFDDVVADRDQALAWEMIRTAAQTDLSWEEHPHYGDQQLADALEADWSKPASALRYRPLQIPMADLEHSWQDPQDFLMDGDDEGYRNSVEMAEMMRAGQKLPPITVSKPPTQPWWPKDYPTNQWQVADGWHRIAAAVDAGVPHLDALEAYDPTARAASTKTADSPITQADATNDALGKSPALIPGRDGDPDYLKASICPNCLQTHRPDEPCPDSSVTQYKQQERQWYNRDPNAIHGAPEGLQDHQADLGKLADVQSPVMYHVAPADADVSQGLRPNAPTGGHPHGVYLFPSQANAEYFADTMRARDEDEYGPGPENERHIYQVDTQGLPLQPDPAVTDADDFQATYPEPLQSYYHAGAIPADRVRRVSAEEEWGEPQPRHAKTAAAPDPALIEIKESLAKLAGDVANMQKPGPPPEGKKPRKLVINRDDAGRMSSIEEV